MTNRSKLVLSGLVVAGVAAALWSQREADRPVPEPVALRASLAPGFYDLSYDFAMQLPSAPTPARATTQVKGRLELAAAPGLAEGRWMAVRGTIDRVELNDLAAQFTDLPADAAKQELSSAWRFRLDDRGEVTDVLVPETLSASARAMLTSVAYAGQLVGPGAPSIVKWKSPEEDLNGPYTAQYERTGEREVKKSWRLAAGGRGVVPGNDEAYSGEANVRFTLDGDVLTKVELTQKGSAIAGTADGGQRATFTLSLVLTRSGGPADVAWVAALQDDGLRPLDPSEVDVRSADGAPPRPLADVLADVNRVKSKLSIAAHSALRSELTRAVAADPAAPAKLESILRKGGQFEEAENLLVEALVGARTREAQRTVAAMFSAADVARDTQLKLLQASALMTEPGPEFVESLGKLVGTHADFAYRAQAAMVYAATTKQMTDTGRIEAVVKDLAEQAKPVLTPGPAPEAGKPGPPPGAPVGVRIDWVLALGNTGAPETRDLIVNTLENDPDELVRAAAADALRFLDPATVRDVMDRVMATDDSLHVRYALTQTARTMGPAAMEDFAAKALFFDSSEYVRLGAAFTVATWVPNAPAMRRVLADALERETSPKVRDSLLNYLTPGRIGDGVQARPLPPQE